MNSYTYDFNPKDCDKVYFKELLLLLDNIDPEKEKYERMKPKTRHKHSTLPKGKTASTPLQWLAGQ